MTGGRNIPTSLSAVAYIFLFMAFLSVVDITVSASRGHFHPNFDLLGFWIYAGLRRYSRGWRTCALVMIWLGFIGCGCMIAVCLFCLLFNAEQIIQAPPFGFQDFTNSEREFIWPLILATLLFVLQLWQYRVLTRPSIRSLFYGQMQPSAT